MEDLLQHSLERISALYKFYNLEKEHIEAIAEEGMKHNILGFAMEKFFQMLLFTPENRQSGEMFQKVKDIVAEFIEYNQNDIKKSSNGNRYIISYRYRDQEVLEKNGIEVNIQKSASEYKQYEEMPRIHSENTFIMLITRFEEF